MSPKHYYEENNFYFITTVTENRVPIFKDYLACELLISLLTYHKFSCNYNLKAFVIMPDHVHLIIQPMGKDNISDIMKRIKGNFSRYYNRIHKRSGTVFQKGFYDTAIRDEKHCCETIDYIHYNPVKKGIVIEAKDYLYSSYKFYCENDEKFLLLLMPLDELEAT
ncbi:REP element-mobilizing transposase RayT [Geosporobacter subterraneus DSM 17957]|uniref:REP element-mobilizing transposase RayT n=1 Tax=Geosporobacter subterraneus DSM 17957 TaxID=1121919 RepID=A0A1M6CMI8_9FIRM|nr:transposase [Geosporobacter subterraneus]SHI62227.1 REP element-mobilizing transposase RayT [Geosporobacter subterraneus DSM 17957]